jgi:hypothetical protein
VAISDIGTKKMFKNNAQNMLTVFGHSEMMRSHTERKNTTHMRTKTLLLTAALSAAGLLPSMAQVFSVNAVGYVKVSMPGGDKLAIIAPPLNGTPNNDVNNTIKLPDPGSSGCLLFRWDAAIQQFRNPVTWFDGFGWFIDDDGDGNPDPVIINPGEACWLQNVTGSQLDFTMVGDVPAGIDQVNRVVGVNKLDLKSARVPRNQPLGDTTVNATGTLNFPAEPNDLVFIWDVLAQQFENPWTYFANYGWFRDENPNPTDSGGPVIPPGSGFWSQKAQASPDADWKMSFSVSN